MEEDGRCGVRPKSGDLRLASKVASMVCYEHLEVGRFVGKWRRVWLGEVGRSDLLSE